MEEIDRTKWQSQADEALISSIKEKMETFSFSVCIFRIPENLSRENEKAYFPHKVSIGPFHNGKPTLKEMEDHKWRYLYSLLSRNPKLEASLNSSVKVLRESEHRARIYYAEKIDLTSDEFVQMMLVDGCFIIELFLKYSFRSLRYRTDPIFSIQGMLFEIRNNLILLENQIPLFVLQRLFNIVPIPQQCNQSFIDLAFPFFRNMIPGDQHNVKLKFSQEGNHLLDLIRHCFLPTYPRFQPKQQGRSQNSLICASNLQKKGIKFKKATTESLLNIKLVNGILEIPTLKFHQNTESLFRNLIALELLSSDAVKRITSYVKLMGSLICSDKDVKMLRKCKIFGDFEENEKEVLELFKKLHDEVNLEDFYYQGLCEQVIDYKRKDWKTHWQKFKVDHRNTLALIWCF